MARTNTVEPNFDPHTEIGICAAYIGGISTLKLAKQYGCRWDSTINKVLIRHGIERRDRSHMRRQYDINEHVFAKIDTEEKAYFLGLLYADGGNVGQAIYLSLDPEDRCILERFNRLLESNKPIAPYTNNAGYAYLRLSISNKTLVNRLQQLGVVPRKTYDISMPRMNNTLTRAFIRGYYDGDGCLTIQKKRNKAIITITSNEHFCYGLKETVERLVPINCLVVPIKGKQVKRFVVSGNRQILTFLRWLYDGSDVHLPRKYAKFQQLEANPKANS